MAIHFVHKRSQNPLSENIAKYFNSIQTVRRQKSYFIYTDNQVAFWRMIQNIRDRIQPPSLLPPLPRGRGGGGILFDPGMFELASKQPLYINKQIKTFDTNFYPHNGRHNTLPYNKRKPEMWSMALNRGNNGAREKISSLTKKENENLSEKNKSPDIVTKEK